MRVSIEHSVACGLRRALVCLLMLGAASTAISGGPTGYKQGKGGTLVDGAAGPNRATGHSGIQRCDKPFGAVTVVEPQSYVMQALSRRGLQSPTSLGLAIAHDGHFPPPR